MVHDEDDDYDLPVVTVREPGIDDPAFLESEAYRKRNDFRNSVLEASMLFDQLRQARQIGIAASGAGLTMVAGGRRKSGGGLDGPAMADRLADACKKSGRRNRKNRKKTNSDLSAFLRN
jgi:hypothetical protein